MYTLEKCPMTNMQSKNRLIDSNIFFTIIEYVYVKIVQFEVRFYKNLFIIITSYKVL